MARSFVERIDPDRKEVVERTFGARRRDDVSRRVGIRLTDQHGWVSRNLLSKTVVFC